MVPYIYERTWRVLEFDEPCLVTSDEPVAFVEDPNAPGGPRGGLKLAPQIVLPIDPRRALVMIHPKFDAEDCRARGTPRQAEIINLHVAFNAHRFIVRTPGTNPLAGMTVPEKAPPVAVVGGLIGMTQNFSAEAHAEVVQGMRRYLRRRPG